MLQTPPPPSNSFLSPFPTWIPINTSGKVLSIWVETTQRNGPANDCKPRKNISLVGKRTHPGCKQEELSAVTFKDVAKAGYNLTYVTSSCMGQRENMHTDTSD